METNIDTLPQPRDTDTIGDKIYTIRGVHVMLDFDLAELYHVETKRINVSVISGEV